MDKNQFQENLASVKGFDDNYAGRSLFRSIINSILRLTSSVIVDSQRPNYYTELSEDTISAAISSIVGLEIGENRFSVRFKYSPNDELDAFVDILSGIWFSYEQPSAIFLFDESENEAASNFTWRTDWKTITEKFKSVIVFKSVEDDVMWIGKSSEIDFDDFLLD